MELELSKNNDIAILKTEGYLDAQGGEVILSAYNSLIDEGIHQFVINLQKTKSINSTGVFTLLQVAERAKTLGNRIVFCGATPTIAKTFEIMGLLLFATVRGTEEEALQFLEGGMGHD